MAEVEFFGEKIRLAEEISEFALMEFAEAASADEESLEAMGAVMRLLREAVDPADWPRFKAVARQNKATVAACMPIVVSVFEQGTERPTSRPSDSSDGPRVIEPNSGGDSSSLGGSVKQRYEAMGRPDLALVVKDTLDFRSA